MKLIIYHGGDFCRVDWPALFVDSAVALAFSHEWIILNAFAVCDSSVDEVVSVQG